MSSIFKRLLLIAAGAFLMAGCEGSDGAPGAAGAAGADGQDAVDTGNISVTVTSSGGPVAGVTVTTTPATVSVDTDATGVALLADVPIGAYDVTATIGATTTSESNVGVAAGLTTDVSFTVSGIPGMVSGTILAPDGTPVVGAVVSAPGSADVTTDAAGAFMIDSVVSEFLSVTPPAGSNLLAADTRSSVRPGDVVSIELSGGPASDATFLGSDVCLICHSGGLANAWMGSGHYRVVERSLVEMDLNGWPADPGPGLCSTWFDTGVVSNIPGEPSTKGAETHGTYIRTCNDNPDPRYEVLFDSDTNGVADELVDLVVPVYATYGGPGTQAGEIAVLQDRGEATNIHGAWKQRYMFSIADLGTCSSTNPEDTFDKNPKPAWVSWDTTQTCEDMLILPIQYNQRTLEWVSYHPWEWYEQKRAYSKKCSGCHEAGITLTAVNGLVTEYAAADYRIGCEKCHGPGSSHVANAASPNFIMNPNHMTAQAATEICGACHNRGSDPIDGTFGFPWRSDVADFDGNFVAGLHTLTWDAVDAPEGYFLEKPGRWPTGFPKKHRQQYNSFFGSAHMDNPYEKVTCYDCHSPHSGKGGPFRYSASDFASGDEYVYGDNSEALMSNTRCLSCHASHGPFATLSQGDVATYHTAVGGSAELNGAAFTPDAASQTAALDLVEQVVKTHSGEAAGMPFAPYVPTESHIPVNYDLGEGPVGRCTSCHMTKTAKSGTWFVDADGLTIAGDNTDHSFQVVEIQPGTDQPNACGSCHASFRTSSIPPGGD